MGEVSNVAGDKKKSFYSSFPKSLTTVTPLSKFIALTLFLSLPFVGFYLGVKYQQQLTVSSPIVVPLISTSSPSLTANWETYSHTLGKYQVSYPKDYTLNIAKSVGVDGVVTQANDSYLELISRTIPDSNGNLKISIDFTTGTNYKTPKEVASTAGCSDISNEEGATYRIGDTDALIFENTNCGPRGLTQIYVVKNGRAYDISIEVTADYKDIKPEYERILSTFKFID